MADHRQYQYLDNPDFAHREYCALMEKYDSTCAIYISGQQQKEADVLKHKISKMVSDTGHRLNSWEWNVRDIQALLDKLAAHEKDWATMCKYIHDSNESAVYSIHPRVFLSKMKELKRKRDNP